MTHIGISTLDNTNPTDVTIDTYNTIADLYTDKYFTDTSDFEHIDRFISAVKPRGSILEVGCGSGQFSKYLGSKGFSTIGIDLSDSMLSLAKKKVPEGTFQVMDMRSLSFEDVVFDGIIAPYSLIHIPDDEVVATLKGFHRVVKKSGALCVVVQEGEKDHVVQEPFAPDKQIFFNFFTKERIKEYVSNAGFRDIVIKTVPCDDPYAMSSGIIYLLAIKD